MSELRLDGKVAIITGAGRGLGRAYALLFAERGASVVVNDLGGDLAGDHPDASPAQQVVEEIRSAGGRAVANTRSVATEEGARSIVEQAQAEFGGLHIVLNNAGNFTPAAPLAEMPIENFQRLWDVHVMGTINVIRAAWPTLVAQRYGRIINTGSHTAYFGLKHRYNYSAVKGAIHGFTVTLAMDAEEHGIRVNLIAPGAATRPVTEDIGANYEVPAFVPELVAPTALWLAHDSCDINGKAIGSQAGMTDRIVIAETFGYQSRHPTPEAIRDHAADILDVRDGANLVFPATAEERGGALIKRFDELGA